MRPKFGDVTSEDNPYPVRHVWKPVYDRRKSGKSEKLVVAVAGSGIDLILKLTEICPEPFGILYVLVVPINAESGRYQRKEWLDRSSLVSYLERYRAFLEGDGRHNIWLNCDEESLIVYDRHEILFLYGDLDGFCGILDSLGYESGEVAINFPHEHHYLREYDDDQFSIVGSSDYKRFELVPGQDD